MSNISLQRVFFANCPSTLLQSAWLTCQKIFIKIILQTIESPTKFAKLSTRKKFNTIQYILLYRYSTSRGSCAFVQQCVSLVVHCSHKRQSVSSEWTELEVGIVLWISTLFEHRTSSSVQCIKEVRIPYFFDQTPRLLFISLHVLCSYYSWAVFISLESLETSTTAG